MLTCHRSVFLQHFPQQEHADDWTEVSLPPSHFFQHQQPFNLWHHLVVEWSRSNFKYIRLSHEGSHWIHSRLEILTFSASLLRSLKLYIFLWLGYSVGHSWEAYIWQ